MSPAVIALIIQGIQAAIAAAPQIIEVVTAAKNFISSLTSAKAISVQQQNLIHAHIDAYAALVAQGIIPQAWQVQPDPA